MINIFTRQIVFAFMLMLFIKCGINHPESPSEPSNNSLKKIHKNLDLIAVRLSSNSDTVFIYNAGPDIAQRNEIALGISPASYLNLKGCRINTGFTLPQEFSILSPGQTIGVALPNSIEKGDVVVVDFLNWFDEVDETNNCLFVSEDQCKCECMSFFDYQD